MTIAAATELRFAHAFAEGALITAQAAAELIGIDVKTLRAMTDKGAIRAVPVGKQRRYAEADLRLYLAEGVAECPSTSRRKAASPSRQSAKIYDFAGARPGDRGTPRRR